MFKLVAVQEHDGVKAYAVFDESDGSFDIVSEEFIKRVTIMGLPISGVHPTDSDGNFTYTEENFIPIADDSEDDEDYDDWDNEVGEDEEDTADASDEEYEDLDYDGSSEDGYEDEDDYSDDWDDGEWDDDCFVEDSEVDKLYALLSKEQGDLLKRYYLWTSQILFDNNGVSGVKRLSAKNTKKAQEKIATISALRGQGKTWVYAGYLDLGYRGADYCNLCGAPLRYQHYICDASVSDIDQLFWGSNYDSIDMRKVNENIRNGHIFPFGIECTGDFFDIDKEDLDKIKKNQRDATDEMKFMYRLMQMPDSYTNARASFRVFEEVMDAVSVSVARSKLFGQTSKFETPLMSFYTQFKEAGILYPRSLVSRLLHVFLGKNYPLRTTSVVGFDEETLKSLGKEYTYKVVKTLDSDDRKRVSEVFDNLNARTVSPSCYMQNLFMYQFMGIYSYNPQAQKDVKGVIDSPRCRDFGGSNKNSRETYVHFTGMIRDSELRVPEAYKGYPYCLNKPYIRRVKFNSGCEFTPEYLVKLCLFCYYAEYVYSHSLSGLLDIKLLGITSDTERGNNFKKRSDKDYIRGSSAYDYLRQAEMNVNNGERFSRDTLKTKGYDVYIDTQYAGSSRVNLYVSSIDEAVKAVKEDYDTLHKIFADVEKEANALVDKFVDECNERAEQILQAEKEEQARREEEKRKKEEIARQVQNAVSQSTSTSTATVSVSNLDVNTLNYSGISSTSVIEFKNLVKKFQSGTKIAPSSVTAVQLVLVASVAEVNPPLRDQLNAQGSIYLDILGTVRKNKGTVTTRQRYRLEQAFDIVMRNFAGTAPQQQNSNAVEQSSSSVNPVEGNTVSTQEVVNKVHETPRPTTVSVNSKPDIVQREPVVEPQVSVKADESVQSTSPKQEMYNGVVDITQDKELKDKFNFVVSNLAKLKGMVDARTFTSYGFALRSIKATLKVNAKQRETLNEMFNLINSK